jgi:hypothetical protein
MSSRDALPDRHVVKWKHSFVYRPRFLRLPLYSAEAVPCLPRSSLCTLGIIKADLQPNHSDATMKSKTPAHPHCNLLQARTCTRLRGVALTQCSPLSHTAPSRRLQMKTDSCPFRDSAD